MSITHRKVSGAQGIDVEALRASILQNVTAEVEASQESIIANIRENLVSAPAAGEEWNEKKSYITGDTATDGGVSYTALRFSRGRQPSLNPERWALTPTEAEIAAWNSIEDGTVITVGTQVTHNGKKWVCTAQHIKSSVYSPRAISLKWEEVAEG